MNILDYVNRGFVPYFMIDLEIIINRELNQVYFLVPDQPDKFIAFNISNILEDAEVWSEISEIHFQEIFDFMLEYGYVCVGRVYSDVDLEYLVELEAFKKLEYLIHNEPNTKYKLYTSSISKDGRLISLQTDSNPPSPFKYLNETLQFSFEWIWDHLTECSLYSHIFALENVSEKQIREGNYLFKLIYNPKKISQFELIFPE